MAVFAGKKAPETTPKQRVETMQLELFSQPLDRKIETLEEKYDKLRKSQHARITGLQKEITELKSDLEFLKGHICKGNLFV